jgi:hypothetical protein
MPDDIERIRVEREKRAARRTERAYERGQVAGVRLAKAFLVAVLLFAALGVAAVTSFILGVFS